MIDTILKLKGLYKLFHFALILFCLGYLTNSFCEDYQPINIVPLYRDAIKAVDPLEHIKKRGGYVHLKDFVISINKIKWLEFATGYRK